MSNLKRRIDNIEASLSGGEYLTLEDLICGVDPNDPRRMPPALEKAFSELETKNGQD